MLKHCPFCSTSVTLIVTEYESILSGPHSEDCFFYHNAESLTIMGNDEYDIKKLEASWNRRATQQRLPVRFTSCKRKTPANVLSKMDDRRFIFVFMQQPYVGTHYEDDKFMTNNGHLLKADAWAEWFEEMV